MNRGLATGQIISWTFGCCAIAGLIGILLSWKTKLPISGSQSVPAAVLLGTALAPFTFEQAAGSYLVAGLLMLMLGIKRGRPVHHEPVELLLPLFSSIVCF